MSEVRRYATSRTWLDGYKTLKQLWPPSWDSAALERILGDERCVRALLDLQERYDDENYGMDILECCLSSRDAWEQLPKITEKDDEAIRDDLRKGGRAVNLFKGDRLRLLEAHYFYTDADGVFMPVTAEALAMHPKLVGNATLWLRDEYARLAGRPKHRSGARTLACHRLLRAYRQRNIHMNYGEIARLVNAITGDPIEYIEAGHVQKLDIWKD